MPQHGLQPHDPTAQRTSVRLIYIQNLTDLLHVCLTRNDIERAKRAWRILIQCREVDWKSRWYWALHILNAESMAMPKDARFDTSGRDAEKWLRQLRVISSEKDRPAILHALVLNLVKHERYRAALEELETYLSSLPYINSAPLHTYAGMLCFYLAQPESARQSSTFTQSSSFEGNVVNASLMRSASSWLAKALEIDHQDSVAAEFYRLTTAPTGKGESDEESDHEYNL